MKRETGFTLVELMLVLAVGALLVVSTAAYSVPWMAREGLRGAVYNIHTTIQLARMEAVNRNRVCRFVVDTANRSISVWDGMGTNPSADDVLLYRTTLPSSASFATPDGSASVSMVALGGSQYGARLNSEGGVNTGTGVVSLFAGGRYGRVSLYAAGGTLVEGWNGTAWKSGL